MEKEPHADEENFDTALEEEKPPPPNETSQSAEKKESGTSNRETRSSVFQRQLPGIKPTLCLGALLGIVLMVVQSIATGVVGHFEHKRNLEMREKEFEALDRREMIKVALAQLTGQAEMIDENTTEGYGYSTGEQALRKWALETFDSFNQFSPIENKDARAYLLTGKGFTPGYDYEKLKWGGFKGYDNYGWGGFTDYDHYGWDTHPSKNFDATTIKPNDSAASESK